MDLYARFASGLDCFSDGDGANDKELTGVSVANSSFTVAEDLSALVAGDKIGVIGSTGNDGVYTVVSTTTPYVDHTTIVVSETIPDATVDGSLFPGHSVGVADDVFIPGSLTVAWGEFPDCASLTVALTGSLTVTLAADTELTGCAITVNGMLELVMDGLSLTTNGALVVTGGTLDFNGLLIVGDCVNLAIAGGTISGTGSIHAGDCTLGVFGYSSTIALNELVVGNVGTTLCEAATVDIGSMTVGNVAGSFISNSVMYIDNLVCGDVAGDFLIKSLENSYLYLTTSAHIGNVTGTVITTDCRIAQNDQGMAAGDITVGDIGMHFATSSDFVCQNITCGNITYDFLNDMVANSSANDVKILSCGDHVFYKPNAAFSAMSLRVDNMVNGDSLIFLDGATEANISIPHIVIGTKFSKPLDILNTGLL